MSVAFFEVLADIIPNADRRRDVLWHMRDVEHERLAPLLIADYECRRDIPGGLGAIMPAFPRPVIEAPVYLNFAHFRRAS